MKSRILFYIAIISVFCSIAIPFFLYQGSDRLFSERILMVVGIFILIGVSFSLLVFSNNKKKGTIFIAYDFSELEFVKGLNAALIAQNYVCYPDISTLLGGSQIKDLKLDQQLTSADLLVVLLSEDSTDSNYINYIVKYFKRLNKPIQIYTFTGPEVLPSSLKQYIIFPLPNETQQAIRMVINLVNALFSRNK